LTALHGSEKGQKVETPTRPPSTRSPCLLATPPPDREERTRRAMLRSDRNSNHPTRAPLHRRPRPQHAHPQPRDRPLPAQPFEATCLSQSRDHEAGPPERDELVRHRAHTRCRVLAHQPRVRVRQRATPPPIETCPPRAGRRCQQRDQTPQLEATTDGSRMVSSRIVVGPARYRKQRHRAFPASGRPNARS
jgi:hypothetical protein